MSIPWRHLRSLRPWDRHSLVLTVAGVVYFLIGLAYAAVPSTPQRNIQLSVALGLFPFWVWGIIFMIVGITSMISTRWPPTASGNWGYGVLTATATIWALFYLAGIPKAGLGGLTAVAVWGLQALLWWAISGLVDAKKVQAPVIITVEPFHNRAVIGHSSHDES